MTDIQIDGDVIGGNVNVGGTQHIQNLTVNNYHNVQPDKPKQISVFLSYARADHDLDYDDPAKSFMRRLYNVLTTVGFAVWWDRVSMPSRGETFTKEIETAIRACQRFVLVVGPGAIASSYVRAEWEFALAQCKPVTPILRAGEFDSIPPAVAEINTIDCRPSREETAAFGDLINRLNEDAPLGDAIGVKALPKGHVIRHEPFHNARDALCADAINPTVISAPPGGVALYGLGGIGKSTMAVALAHDCQVRRHYRDGVLWLEVGQRPNPLTLQAAVGVMLGDSRENYQDETSAALSLSRTLHNKAALIVLDDVWDHKLVEKFPISGTACRLLITTRSRKLAEYVDGADIRLNLLSEAEGARLIAGIIGGDEDDPRFKQITHELGGHTLAIALAAAQIQSRYAKDADDLLRLLRKRATEPDPFRDLMIEDTDKDRNLALSLSLSYDSLQNDDMRRRFRQVGIFVLESTFDREALAAIWGDADEDDARAPLQTLVGAGLLDVEAEGRYSQHRILHMYARALMRNQGELDETFYRYANFVTAQSRQFDTLPLDMWHQLDPLLPHVEAVGDELVERYSVVDSPDETLQTQLSDFAYNIGGYVFYRPQAIATSEGTRLRGMSWLEYGQSANRALGNQRREALILNQLALASASLGNSRQALELYDQALSLFRDVDDQRGQAATLNNIGLTYNALGDPRKAIGYFQHALPLCRDSGDRPGEAATLTNIGGIWHTLGRLHEALDFYERALSQFRLLGDRRGEAETLHNIGSIWVASGDTRKALGILEHALLLRRAVGDRIGEASTLNSIGGAWFALDEMQSALAFFDQALPLCRVVGYRAGEASALHNIGSIWDALDEKRKALMFYNQALVIQRETGDRAGEATTCCNIGLIYHGFGDLDKAIKYVEHCVALDEQLEHPDLERDCQTLAQLKAMRDGEIINTPNTLSPDTVQVLAENTVAVMTNMPEKREEWRGMLLSHRDEWSTQGENWQIEVEFADTLLSILNGQEPAAPDKNPYAGVVVQVNEAINNHRNGG